MTQNGGFLKTQMSLILTSVSRRRIGMPNNSIINLLRQRRVQNWLLVPMLKFTSKFMGSPHLLVGVAVLKDESIKKYLLCKTNPF